ncbi:uncharacterized protein EI97DRAFT_372377 [Westerdykella ornata]|uniref:Uncharacterized protein n=1 Tax=Westerdykella ornata TaxID=318751 RepID=A0A6A6JQT5_WESOR|nr:uncharacterized protein EI97DRAFT_372377 [Westerdykella ornata]KAF2278747.1 hypothetical protein EI97DRAFT_372377 [Westerdykella ornata]
MPRVAPSPSPSSSAAAAAAAAAAAQQQQQHPHPNGMGGMSQTQPGPPNGGGIPMVNGQPSSGHQSDLNFLWGVVQQLSQVLEENRAQMGGIVNGVAAIQARAVEEGGLGGFGVGGSGMANGDGNAPPPPPTLASLTTQLTTTQSHLSSLQSHTNELTQLITDYENALTLLLDKLRPYAYTHTQSLLALHKHYQDLLEKERAATMQVRLEHAEWQAGLGRVAEYARAALKSQAEADLPLRREVKALREENRVLRRLAGWEERRDESSDEEAEERKT